MTIKNIFTFDCLLHNIILINILDTHIIYVIISYNITPFVRCLKIYIIIFQNGTIFISRFYTDDRE